MKFDFLRHVIMSYLHVHNPITVPRARALEAQQWHRCRVPRRRAGHLRGRERRHGAQGGQRRARPIGTYNGRFLRREGEASGARVAGRSRPGGRDPRTGQVRSGRGAGGRTCKKQVSI